MTTATGDSNGQPNTVGGAIGRLNAKDGLFLRAEHLKQMQDYARDLTAAVGMARGSGVVYGFDIEQQAHELVISPGLAIDSAGNPLRSTIPARVPLPKDPAPSGGFWVVQLSAAEWPYGDDNVYGAPCDDACNGSGSIQPWLAEGVTVTLVQDTIIGLTEQSASVRRNWLASHYFERERIRGGPWLTPRVAGQPAPSLGSWPWGTGSAAPTGGGVPIAVLQQLGGNWQVDVWTARREVADPQPRRGWQWRLAMRPWDVFLAQVLQFQNQLASPVKDLALPSSASLEQVVQWLSEARAGVAGQQDVKPAELLNSAIGALSATPPAPAALTSQGLLDLPPAGFLSVNPGSDVESQVDDMLGPDVRAHYYHCRLDNVPQAVELGQHLERIPLTDHANPPDVDVLIPYEKPGWVAFVRTVSLVPDSSGEDVDVHLVNKIGNQASLAADVVAAAKPLTTVRFPAGAWAAPESGAYQQIQHAIRQYPGQHVTVVGLAGSEDRLPLAAVRATLLATTFDPNPRVPEVHVSAHDGKEAIVVVITPPPSS